MNRMSNNSKLKCFYQNSRSVRNKTEDLASLMATNHFDIIQITESWITAGDTDILNLLNNSAYSPFHYMRSEGRGGGAVTLIRSTLAPIQISHNTNLEIVITKISLPAATYLINFYNPHSTNTWVEELIDIIHDISNGHDKTPIILNGDFNSPDWSPQSLNVRDCDIDLLMAETDLTQLVQFPTRGCNYLDLLFTRNSTITDIFPFTWFESDHSGFTFEIPIDSPIQSRIESFTISDFQRTPWNQVTAELKSLHDIVITIKDPKEAYDKWHNEICALINRYVPKRTIRKNHSPPWFDDELKRLNRRKLGAHKRWKQFHNEENYIKFCMLRDSFKLSFKNKAYHYNEKITAQISINPKLFWRTVNFKTKPTQNTKSLPTPRELGEFFSRSVNTPRKSTYLPDTRPLISNVLCQVYTTPEEVLSILGNADLACKSSPDLIHGAILHNAREVLAKTLAHLYNTISRTGYFPTQWKVSNVFPLFKSGDPKLANNYRPIALQPLIAKIYEKIIHHGIAYHVKNAIAQSQHFCIKNRSTTTNLLSTVNTILDHWDKKKDAAIFYADLTKAFDTVDHYLLLHKLKTQFGIANPLLETIRNSLTGRSFRVTIQSETTEPFRITSGVPQGGVLSPLLFTMFVNDLYEEITPDNKLLQYADDSKLIACGDTPQEAINNLDKNIKNINNWCTKWGLSLNPNKSQICIFTKKNISNNLSHNIGDGQIQVKNKVKDLGVWLDQKLTFKHHIDGLNLRLRRLLGVIYRNQELLGRGPAFKSVYFALVQSQIDYGLPIWGGAAPSVLKPLEATQKKIYKLMLKIPRYNHDNTYNELSKRLSIPTITMRRLYLSMSIAYRILADGPFDTELAIKLKIPSYNARTRLTFATPYYRLAIHSRFFLTNVTKTLNKLPDECDPFVLDRNHFLRKFKQTFLYLNTI